MIRKHFEDIVAWIQSRQTQDQRLYALRDYAHSPLSLYQGNATSRGSTRTLHNPFKIKKSHNALIAAGTRPSATPRRWLPLR